ncbi:MAG: formyltransferase family protein [Rhizobiaceae bacterium]
MKVLLVTERSNTTESVLRGLLDAGHDVVEVWSQMPPQKMYLRSSVRYLTKRARCLGTLLVKYKITCRQIPLKKTNNLSALLKDIEKVDMLLCYGSSIIFKKEFIDHFQGKAFNCHPSLLPKYRGPLPEANMLMDGKGDEFGGCTIHQIVPAIDAGDIIAQRVVPRSKYRNYLAWNFAHGDAFYEMVLDDLSAFLQGKKKAVPQDHSRASYHKINERGASVSSNWSWFNVKEFLANGYGLRRKTTVTVMDENGDSSIIPINPQPVRLGKPSNQPAVIRAGSVEMDVLDARIWLQRETKWQKLKGKVDRYRTHFLGR